jgi:hypothetical protein
MLRDRDSSGQSECDTHPGPAAGTELGGHMSFDDQRRVAAQPDSAGQRNDGIHSHDASGNPIAGGLRVVATPNGGAPGKPDTGGQMRRDHQIEIAASNTLPDDGLLNNDHQRMSAIVGEITVHYRRYEDMRRARQRLELQAMATCRSYCDGDKVAGAKLYKEPTSDVMIWLMPYMTAIEPLDAAIAEQEKLLDKFGKKLPVTEWLNEINGLSPRFLAMIVGECGIGPGEYRSVSALWKRMGMAVINGERQRRVTGDAAIEHGYVARRRSLMWNIGISIMKQQVRSEKDDKGKKIDGTDYAIGVYGQLYLDRKAYEATKSDKPIVIHARAKRYMEKRLLRELWKAWRK